MNKLVSNWKDYVWVPSGEVIRGVETTFITTLIQLILALYQSDPERMTHGSTWIFSVTMGAAMVALGYLKGKVPTSGS